MGNYGPIIRVCKLREMVAAAKKRRFTFRDKAIYNEILRGKILTNVSAVGGSFVVTEGFHFCQELPTIKSLVYCEKLPKTSRVHLVQAQWNELSRMSQLYMGEYERTCC